jgi:small subunit ribosomal protein S17
MVQETRTPETGTRAVNRKSRVGTVVSDATDKTVVVAIERAAPHRLYRKVIRRTKKYHVHDPENQATVGDLVRIEECRPVSKTKRWQLAEVLTERQVAEVRPEELDREVVSEFQRAGARMEEEAAEAPEAAAEAPEAAVEAPEAPEAERREERAPGSETGAGPDPAVREEGVPRPAPEEGRPQGSTPEAPAPGTETGAGPGPAEREEGVPRPPEQGGEQAAEGGEEEEAGR